MAPGPSSSSPLLPGFLHDPDDSDGPQESVTPHAEEDPHAVQNHRPRVDPGAVSGAARAALQPQGASIGGDSLRDRPENLPQRLGGGIPSGKPADGPGPDREQGAGAGGGGPAGGFTLRVTTE